MSPGCRIHTLGSARRSQSHPDSRAIFFEDVTYSKRKIEDFLSTLGGFKAAQRLLAKVKVTAADFRSVCGSVKICLAESCIC